MNDDEQHQREIWESRCPALLAMYDAAIAERDTYRDGMLKMKELAKSPEFGWGYVAQQKMTKLAELEAILREGVALCGAAYTSNPMALERIREWASTLRAVLAEEP